MSQTRRRNTIEARLRSELKAKDAAIAERDSRLHDATVLWKKVRAELVALRDMHAPVERSRQHAGVRTVAIHCRRCTSDPYPCATVRDLDRTLIRLETR